MPFLISSDCLCSHLTWIRHFRRIGMSIFFNMPFKILFTLYSLELYSISDDEAPTLDCQNVVSTTDIGENFSSSVTINSTATDNVDPAPSVNCSHTSSDTFPEGNTTVTCWSTDNAGNTGNCTIIVTVIGIYT